MVLIGLLLLLFSCFDTGKWSLLEEQYDIVIDVETPASVPTGTPSPTPALPAGKYPDYTYIRSIEIIENSGNALSDYQVLISLNTGNFNYSNVLDANGNDLRFDYNDIECSYWIETWDTGGESRIWVKIPALGSNQTESLNMFYGYNSALAQSHGENTFLLFDDFDDNSFDATKWVDISSGTATVIETGQRLTCSLDNAAEARGFLRSANQLSETNFALHLSSLFQSTESGLIAVLHFDGNHTALYDHASNGFNFDWMTNLNKFAVDTIVNDTKDRTVESLGYPADLSWHDFQYRYHNQNLQILFDDSVALDGTNSTSFSTFYIGLASREKYDSDPNSNTYLDDVFVRKYVVPEPGVVIGAETLNS